MTGVMLERLGMPGIAGIGLLLFCLPFYFGNVAPAQTELANLENERAQLAATAAGRAAAAHGAAGARETGSAQPLPPLADAPEVLKQLNSLAEKYGVVVERASYQMKGKDGQRQLEIGLPLKFGSYPTLRAYLREALALTASASLEELSVQRQQASDAGVEVQLRLSYSFGGAS